MIKIPNPYKHWIKGDYTTSKEIQKLIRHSAITCGIEDIYPDIKWSFSPRLVRNLGVAEWWYEGRTKCWNIKFASQLWMGMNSVDRKNTIVHEVCHLAVERLYGHGGEVLDHGTHWKELMRKCGEDPDLVSYGNW